MIKKIIVITTVIAITGLLIFGAVNRSLAKTSNEQTDQYRSGQSSAQAGERSNNGYGNNNSAGIMDHNELLADRPAASGDLDAAETAALLFMLEEEKLAHDVYVTLYDQWNLPLFQNIAASELTHMESIKTLLDRYSLAVPVSDQIGEYNDPSLQELYTVLVEQGSQSLEEALKVGAIIEELDIMDLQEYLKQIQQADIQQVFQNLLNGSGNHLRSFVDQYQARTGEMYQPQYLSQSAYQEILSTTNGNGNQVRRGSGGRGQSGKQ